MKNKLLVYLVPAIMFVVAAVQFYNVQSGLTRWKGGGYGMYSDFHANRRQVWVTVKDSLFQVTSADRSHRSSFTDLIISPNQAAAEALGRSLSKQGHEVERIDIYRPTIDVEAQTLCKTIIHSYAITPDATTQK